MSSSAIGTRRCATMSPASGLRDHVVQGHAGLVLAVDQHPVDRAAAAIARQQRAVQVERAARRDVEHRLRQQPPIVEGEEEVGRPVAQPRHPFGRVEALVGEDRQAVLASASSCTERNQIAIARIVGVGEDRRDLGAELEQR